jgi:HAD superfamily hydrolase (TIGR01509 family)
MGKVNLPDFKAAIFDLDGTLVESEPAWLHAKAEYASSEGIALPAGAQERYIGRRLSDFVGDYPGSMEPVEAIARIEALAEDAMPEMARPMPGAVELVRLCRDAGLALAVCSSAPLRFISAALERLEIVDLFEVLVSAADMAQGKPHPAPYLKTLDLMGVAAAEAVAFEDSLPGAQSGCYAGIFTVAIGPGCTGAAFAFCDARFESAGAVVSALQIR